MPRSPEYDAFGPWTYHVRTPEDVPRLYRRHGIDPAAERLVLKVPRAIERRDANPEMHLYDHLLVAGSASLTVLSRKGDTYQTVEVPYERIGAIHHSISMLDGRLVVHDVDGLQRAGIAVAIRYSAVSKEVVDELVELLRTQALAARSTRGVVVERPGRAPVPSTRVSDIGDADTALVTAQLQLADKRSGLVLLGAQPRVIVPRRDAPLRRVLDALRPVTLHAALVCADAGTVEFVHRRDWFTSHPRPAWSVAHTVVLSSAVTAVGSHEHPRYVGVYRVQVATGRGLVELAFPDGAETGAAIAGALAGVRAI